MISSEVQRTLVKSPPELWAELSDPGALARHLGELGEIRIVRTEPEKTVEWTAENTTGTVSIQPSGWGTKVTLSVTREIAEQATEAEPDPEATEAGAAPDPAVIDAESADAEPEAIEAEPTGPEAAAESAPETDPVATAEPRTAAEPEPSATAQAEIEPPPRRGFFARLFGRRHRAEMTQPEPASGAPSTNVPDAFAAVRQALAQESFAAVHPFAAQPAVSRAPEAAKASEAEQENEAQQESETEQASEAERIGDISAELMAAEEVAAEEVTAVLAAVLDRLGAAHHRPFSRA